MLKIIFKNCNMEKSVHKGNYKKFLLMLLLSFCIMYLVMFLNVDELDHIYLSLTRLYMSLLMVAPMAVLMLAMMQKMYPNKKANAIIMLSSCVVFVLSLTLLRTQTPIDDTQYMKAMIPHHSSAIMTSKHADIKDPEVKELSKKIILSQQKEIAQMKALLKKVNK